MKRLLTLNAIIIFMFAQAAWAANEWNEHKSKHFIIFYKEAPKDFINSVEASAERYYDEITRNLGFTRYKNWTFNKRAKIYIYNDQEDYVKSSKLMNWSHGAASAKRKEIYTFPSAHGFFDSTLPHELGHIIFREFVGYKSQIPPWVDEGVAMYQEKAKRWGANKVVKKAIAEGYFIPVEDLTYMRLTSATPRSTIELYYAEAASLIYFIITELGEYRFVRFCRKLNSGAGFNNALHSIYVRYKKLEDLEKAWLRYLDQ